MWPLLIIRICRKQMFKTSCRLREICNISLTKSVVILIVLFVDILSTFAVLEATSDPVVNEADVVLTSPPPSPHLLTVVTDETTGKQVMWTLTSIQKCAKVLSNFSFL